jgi:signal transduction histidine kinase
VDKSSSAGVAERDAAAAVRRGCARDAHLVALGGLAAGIAHEINTPAQFIGDNLRFLADSFAELSQLVQRLRFAPGIDPSSAEDVDFLLSEVPRAIDESLEGVARIADIVQAMRQFSLPARDEAEPVDVNATIRRAVTITRNEWKYVAELTLDLDEDLPLVPCFAGELNQVLLNLLVNAAHAVEASSRSSQDTKGAILVSTRRDALGATIVVTDNGAGIPDHLRERVFERFFTTKASGKGTGQGLALCKQFVERLGGTIGFVSTVGTGTAFSVVLPLELGPETSGD